MRFLVRKLDDIIRKSIGVFEFSYDENCLLRLQVIRAPRTLQLPNLTIEPGDQVLLLHLWNERLPLFSAGSADMAWARCFLRLINYSFCLVAGYLHDDPQLSEVRAVGGETILLSSGLHEAGRRFVQDLGFTVTPYHRRLGRFGEFWENFYSWLIIWTFNPGSLPSRSLLYLSRSEMWISREAFLQRFGKRR